MTEKVSRKAHFKRAGGQKFVGLAVLVAVAFLVSAYCRKDWEIFLRAGGVISLLGGILSCRRVLRLGLDAAKENEPMVINRNQVNIKAIFQRVEDVTDSFAQELGLWLILVGSVISTVGDIPLRILFPFDR